MRAVLSAIGMSSPQVLGEGVTVDYRGALARRSRQPGLKRSGSVSSCNLQLSIVSGSREKPDPFPPSILQTPEHNVLDPPAKIVIGGCTLMVGLVELTCTQAKTSV